MLAPQTQPSRPSPDERVLRQFLEHTPSAVAMFDRDMRYILASRRWVTDYHLPSEDILGRSHYDVFPEIPQRWKDIHQRCLAGAVETCDEDRFPRADGRVDWVRWEVRPWRNDQGEIGGVIMFTEVITERKQTQDALRASEGRLRHLAEAVRVIPWSADPVTCQFTYVGPQAEGILGYPCEEWLRDGFWAAHIHPDDRDAALAYCEEQSQVSEHYNFDYRMIAADGRVVWIHDVVQVWTDPAGEKRLRGFLIDVTAQKEAEEQRRQLEARVLHAQKLESLGVLAGGIAHDFNNLLTGILGYASLALMDLPAGTPVRNAVEQIHTASLRAADLTQQMLAYSGRGRFVIRPLHLSRLVEEMANLLHSAVSKNALVHSDLDPNLPPVEADATQMRQVVMNLITNASDAIGARAGLISLRTGVTHADEEYLTSTYVAEDLPSGDYVFLEVSDTGCGMDGATLQRIFDPFFSTKFTGRGLGLAAVLGIVRGHKGAIKVSSEVGRGTTFKLLLPVARGASVSAAEASPRPEAWRGAGTVLVIDDEMTVRSVAKSILESAGFKVTLAEDGLEGLRKFQEQRDEIAAVVLDLTMPHLGGEETFRELRLIRPDVVVVLISGFNEHEVVSLFAGKGLAGFVQKPFGADDLLRALRAALTRR